MSELSHLGATSELPSSVIPAPVMNSPEAGRSTPKSSSGGLSIGSLVNPQGDYRYSLGTPAFNGFAQQPMHYVSGFNSTDDTIFYTPESSQSPVSDYYGRYRHRQSISSSSSITAVDPSGASPLITGNIPGSWAPSSVQPPSMLPSNMLDEGAYFPVWSPFHWFGMCTEADQSPADSSLPVSLSDLDGYEWSVIRRELSNAPGLLPRDASTGIPDTMRWHCLDYYWRYFHPHFPIVHRPTFLPTKPSPLLASAMAAIGSQYDDRPDSKLYSLTLLEIATKLLKKRASITSRSRLADLQTVFLLEVLGKYCARRVEVEMSARFRSFFASLDQARRVLATDALAVFRTLPEDRTKDDVNRAYKFWLEHETRRRILQASTILDLQQVTLFEQQPTIVQHERPRQGSLNLRCTIPLPCSEELWETSPIEAWVEVASRIDASKQVINQKVEGLPPSNMPLDFFQIQVSIAANPELPFDAFFPLSREDQANELGARLTFNHHLREMARHTPIRHLLVVSGESWVLGKKLENEAEFQMAKHDLRAWVNANRESRIALRHATQLIRSRAVFIPSDQTSTDLVPSFLDTHMLHEPWGLYLASLVCWAYGLSASTMLEAGDQVSGVASASTSASEANSQMSRSSSSSMPSTYPTLLDPHAAAYSMRQYLHNTDVGTAEDLVRLDAQVFGQTRGLLEMVRLHKVGHFLGGLMNEAERVLYRLVEGRSRLSHF